MNHWCIKTQISNISLHLKWVLFSKPVYHSGHATASCCCCFLNNTTDFQNCVVWKLDSWKTANRSSTAHLSVFTSQILLSVSSSQNRESLNKAVSLNITGLQLSAASWRTIRKKDIFTLETNFAKNLWLNSNNIWKTLFAISIQSVSIIPLCVCNLFTVVKQTNVRLYFMSPINHNLV